METLVEKVHDTTEREVLVPPEGLVKLKDKTIPVVQQVIHADMIFRGHAASAFSLQSSRIKAVDRLGQQGRCRALLSFRCREAIGYPTR